MRAISELNKITFQDVEPEEKWFNSFFKSGKSEVEKKTLTKQETDVLKKGELITQYSMGFFVPEWF
ncbi:MAG: hypothetical protein JXA41_00145 [Deltaproteobacteria bacterium]|nr:hypothetical protein [Deltaproteobacteria bacterium]